MEAKQQASFGDVSVKDRVDRTPVTYVNQAYMSL